MCRHIFFLVMYSNVLCLKILFSLQATKKNSSVNGKV